MSDSFWKQLNCLAGLMAIAVLFGLTAFSANLEIKDLDLWLHMKTGQYIVESKTVPNHDVLSCSISGKPWNNHEWLFQVVAYSVYKAFDYDGLITMQVIVVSLTFLVLLFICYRRDRQWLAAFLLLMVLLVYQTRFTIRPDIFSLLFFAIYMYVLALHIQKRVAIYVLAFIQVLWVNMHGFFFLGPLFVVIGVFAELVKRRVPLPWEWNTTGRLGDDEFKHLLRLAWVLPLVCVINPAGVEGALYPLKVLFMSGGESKIFFTNIYELQRPFNGNLLANLSEHSQYKALIAVSALSFFFNRRKIDLSVFFLWLFFLLFSLAAIRNMVFFACAAYLVTMVNSMTVLLDDILPFRFAALKFKELTGVIAKILLIMWMLNYGGEIANRGYFDFDVYERKSEYGGVSKRNFPYQAVDFLIANRIKGNFFNDFNCGAYLIGRTYPDIKVFIDGRTEVYGAEFFKTYQKIWKGGNKKIFKELAKKYNITGALLNGANQNTPPKVIQLFYGMKDWKLVYFDHDGMVFLKNTPENQALIAKYAIDLSKWVPKPMDLQRLGSRRIYPFPNIDRAKMLMALKLDVPALRELDMAMKISPDAMEIYQLYGDIYGHQKKYRKSFENFRIATMLMPGDRHNRKGLAWAYEKLQDRANATKQYERLLAEKPGDAKIAEKLKRLKKAKTNKERSNKEK